MGDDNTKVDDEVAGAPSEDTGNKEFSKDEATTSDAQPTQEEDASEAKDSSKVQPTGESPEDGAPPVDENKQTDDNVATTTAAEETSNETLDDEKSGDNPASPTQTPAPIVSSTKKSRPPYKYDPEKITLRFLFANRDGLTVTVECRPGDTVGEVKGALLSVWPSDLPDCSGGDRLRLVCMGKGILMPDTRTLEDCQIPVFKTHPTPVNVSVKPETDQVESAKSGGDGNNRRASSNGGSAGENGEQTGQGCACVIL